MKKYVCFITICLFILFSFSIFANEGIEDSLSFSDSVYQTIENAHKDNTIKIFNGTFMHLFGQRKGIEEIISDENLLEPYYAVKGRFSSAEYYYIREGASCKISIHPPELDSTLSYVLNPSLILNKVSPFLSAQHIYYLNGDLTPRMIKAKGFAGMDYHYKTLENNPGWVAEAHRLGLKVNCWTVNQDLNIEQMVRMGVDFITTDRPVDVLQMVD